MSTFDEEKSRTREIIDALNAPAKQVSDHWKYWSYWRRNWKVVDLDKDMVNGDRRTMLEA
jgi:hypothetical protein